MIDSASLTFEETMMTSKPCRPWPLFVAVSFLTSCPQIEHLIWAMDGGAHEHLETNVSRCSFHNSKT